MWKTSQIMKLTQTEEKHTRKSRIVVEKIKKEIKLTQTEEQL